MKEQSVPERADAIVIGAGAWAPRPPFTWPRPGCPWRFSTKRSSPRKAPRAPPA